MSKTLEQRFKELCDVVQSLPKDGEIQLSNEVKLKFYSYYKQVTEGDCNTTQPYFFNVVERAKWDAWNSVKGMSKENAMKAYIAEMRKVMEGISHNSDIAKTINSLVKD